MAPATENPSWRRTGRIGGFRKVAPGMSIQFRRASRSSKASSPNAKSVKTVLACSRGRIGQGLKGTPLERCRHFELSSISSSRCLMRRTAMTTTTDTRGLLCWKSTRLWGGASGSREEVWLEARQDQESANLLRCHPTLRTQNSLRPSNQETNEPVGH